MDLEWVIHGIKSFVRFGTAAERMIGSLIIYRIHVGKNLAIPIVYFDIAGDYFNGMDYAVTTIHNNGSKLCHSTLL